MKRKLFCPELFALLFAAVVISSFTALERQQQGISDHLIRLHVVANSDSIEDQNIKLQVRDAVLIEAETITSSASSVSEAKRLLSENLELIESAAEERLTELNIDEALNVTLERELFDVRHYDTFSLPGGYYDALRVTIGEGMGRNWWCVVYPGICTAATTEDQRTLAVMAGMTEEEIDLISRSNGKYVFRFKILELFEELMEKVRPVLE